MEYTKRSSCAHIHGSHRRNHGHLNRQIKQTHGHKQQRLHSQTLESSHKRAPPLSQNTHSIHQLRLSSHSFLSKTPKHKKHKKIQKHQKHKKTPKLSQLPPKYLKQPQISKNLTNTKLRTIRNKREYIIRYK